MVNEIRLSQINVKSSDLHLWWSRSLEKSISPKDGRWWKRTIGSLSYPVREGGATLSGSIKRQRRQLKGNGLSQSLATHTKLQKPPVTLASTNQGFPCVGMITERIGNGHLHPQILAHLCWSQRHPWEKPGLHAMSKMLTDVLWFLPCSCTNAPGHYLLLKVQEYTAVPSTITAPQYNNPMALSLYHMGSSTHIEWHMSVFATVSLLVSPINCFIYSMNTRKAQHPKYLLNHDYTNICHKVYLPTQII